MKWTRKYKKSINCKRPRGFSQKQYCKYTRKVGRPTTRYVGVNHYGGHKS